MLLLLMQGRTPDTAIRYHGQGAMTITTDLEAIATARRFHSVVTYTFEINDRNTEYINLDRHGT